MTEIKTLLELRKRIKAKKPDFTRQVLHKKVRLEKKWRRPKGLHSKMRLRHKGHPRNVSLGFRAPKKIRYLHKSGLKSILVNSPNELEKINKEMEGVIIAKTVGLKKKIELLKKIKEKEISLFNIKDIDAYLKEVEEKLKKRKEKKKKVMKEKEKKKQEREKRAEEKGKEEGLTEKIQTEEEKKEAEKKEKDKLLTKKEISK